MGVDLPLSALRVVRAVAELGSFTAAAKTLGYTQSGISRQVRNAEREFGAALFDRLPAGVAPTAQGRVLLSHVSTALIALEDAELHLAGTPRRAQRVRLGHIPAAGASLLPQALRLLRLDNPDIEISTREGSTPSLVRALRAGTLDVAVLTSRPPHRAPDSDDPGLVLSTIVDVELGIAVATDGRFGGRQSVSVHELAEQPWIASTSTRDEPLLGVWPGLPGNTYIRHTTKDWMTKLTLVAMDAGVTTASPIVLPRTLPDIHIAEVHDAPQELRRISAATLPDRGDEATAAVIDALGHAAET